MKRYNNKSAVGRAQLSPAHLFTSSPAHGPTKSDRRGVLILVVLSLLFLFVLIAITFVLVATRQLAASKQYARTGVTGDPPQALLNEAMMQVLRGDTSTYVSSGTSPEAFHSVIGPHSLLESMYGPYTIQASISGTINPNGDATSGAIVEFAGTSPQLAVPSFQNSYTGTNLTNLLQLDGYLEGCVITMTSGSAKGLTSRIVRYDANANLFHVLAFKGDSGNVTPATGDTFVVNGRAFSGTGFGYNPTSYTLDAKDVNSRPFALLPNPMAYTLGGDYPATSPTIPFGGYGGANTDYSAADYQHMAMSFSTSDGSGNVSVILPSFHRPDLVNFWANNATPKVTGGDWSNQLDLLRQIVLRPNPYDNPNFTGSNPKLDTKTNFGTNIYWQPSNGGTPPWDVDNDGDGVPDSIWIDPGFPVEATTDGRLYKPLFAILCEDLDGRLNVNAVGTTEQLASTHTQQVTGQFANGANINSTISLPRGEGYGPAEILVFDPANASSPSPLTTSILNNLLRGDSNFEGRYGEGTNSTTAQAGLTGTPSTLAEVKHYMYPDNSYNPPNTIAPLSSFGSPADLWGRSVVGLDYAGQPLWGKLNWADGTPGWENETLNSPYDINLSQNGPRRAIQPRVPRPTIRLRSLSLSACCAPTISIAQRCQLACLNWQASVRRSAPAARWNARVFFRPIVGIRRAPAPSPLRTCEANYLRVIHLVRRPTCWRQFYWLITIPSGRRSLATIFAHYWLRN